MALKFNKPQVNLYVEDIAAVAGFYLRLGFKETFRTPESGPPIHVELILDGFILGLADIQSARELHHLAPGAGRPQADDARSSAHSVEHPTQVSLAPRY